MTSNRSNGSDTELFSEATPEGQADAPCDGRHVERLLEAIRELSVARDLSRITEIVRSAARNLTGADGATFVLRDGECCHYVDEDAIQPLWKGLRFPIDACISGWTMLHRQPAQIEDIYADSRIPHDAYRSTFVKSLVMVPIRCASPVGAIGTYWARTHTASRGEVRLLGALADCTSVALENVQVYRALDDEARRHTEELAAVRAEFVRSTQSPVVEQGHVLCPN